MTEEYIDYFRKLAVSHKDLQHNTATEAGGEGNKAFARFSADEIVTGQRTMVGERVLYLELFETTYTGDPYSIQGAKSGAFAVYQQGAQNDFVKEEECFVNTERIMEDLLNQIWQDHYGKGIKRCKTPFSYFYFDKDSVIPVGPIFNWYFGWRCEFSFKPGNVRDFTKPLPEGTFLQS